MSSILSIFTPGTCIFRSAATYQFRTSQLCTGASTCPTWVLFSSGFEMCQLSQYRMLNGSIYHGLPSEFFAFQPNQGGYLAFLGRISPEKRVDRAIEIAKRVSMPLKIAAKVDRVDRRYFKRDIEPLLTQSHVEWVDEISDQQKNEFLGNAYALLFPIDWPEPFGLVMIEAMACGTPIIAYDRGSVPEVMENGVTGFIVSEIEQAVEAVGRVRDLSRVRCREVFEKRFTASRMASDYINVYTRLADSRMRRAE